MKTVKYIRVVQVGFRKRLVKPPCRFAPQVRGGDADTSSTGEGWWVRDGLSIGMQGARMVAHISMIPTGFIRVYCIIYTFGPEKRCYIMTLVSYMYVPERKLGRLCMPALQGLLHSDFGGVRPTHSSVLVLKTSFQSEFGGPACLGPGTLRMMRVLPRRSCLLRWRSFVECCEC